ncbi:hypothetical protein [Marinobacter metalliresistant]|uniref:Uncharacterized protein n=1 Tax=Marinobacter metalliresistant TaxID=2961995 RepID=A0ABZ2VYX2_9GAMM
MSELMNIRFDLDMPMTAFEVVTPKHGTIEHCALAAGEEKIVEVPSSDSFIRLRLPTGRTVNLRHAGDLQYLITPNLIRRSATPNAVHSIERGVSAFEYYGSRDSLIRPDAITQLSRLRQLSIAQVEAYNTMRSVEVLDPLRLRYGRLYRRSQISGDVETKLPGDFNVRWKPAVLGMVDEDIDEVYFTPEAQDKPYELTIDGRRRFQIRIPGSVKSAFVRSDLVGTNHYLISVRVGTVSSDADAVGGYIAQSDYVSARTLLDWARLAVSGPHSGETDPYSTILALYLLLRLEPSSLMQDSLKALERCHPDIPDIYIIAAAHCTLGRPRRAKILNYIKQSFDVGLPVYTEGLHWLTQMLRMLGENGERYLDRLGQETQGVVWSSPFTALAYDFDEGDRIISLDVAYALEL